MNTTTYCAKCGTQNSDNAQFCQTCQAALPVLDNVYQPPQTPATSYAAPPATNWQAMGADKKMVAGVCGILIGALGVHKFILGYTTEGIIMLLVTVLTCGFGAIITSIIGLVEGIIYLTKSDEDFVRQYVQNKKGWF